MVLRDKGQWREACQRVLAGFFLMALGASVAPIAHAQQPADAAIVALTGKTILFRNQSDRIPQLEYFRPDGTGGVWSAALGERVVPVVWRADTRTDSEPILCLIFAGRDIGFPDDLTLCDQVSVIQRSILDIRDGDPYGLLEQDRMVAPMPGDANSFADIDAVLGR